MADFNSQPSKSAPSNAPSSAASSTPFDPFANPFMAPFKMFMPKQAAPNHTLTALSKVNMEMVGLATRRTQAIMDVSRKASQCRNSGDLATITTEFWQTAWTQQVESAQKIAALFGATLPAVKMTVAPPVRDVIVVPETTEKPKPEWAGRNDRRAA
jgi:hypothetical protein